MSALLAITALLLFVVPARGLADRSNRQSTIDNPQSASQESEESRIRQEVAYANEAKPAVQGQAVERLVKRGAAAVPPILEYIEGKGHNALSVIFTEGLADLRDERIADLCARLLKDRNFYWRPAAARALANQASPRHLALLRRSLTDRLWGVRAAAVLGLEKLKDRESHAQIKLLLNDPIYDVRAQAAKTLHAFRDESGLPVLVEALRSDVRWFDIDYGQLAREDAWKFLTPIAGTDFGFKPWEPAEQREPGLRKWDEWMERRDPGWRDRLPPSARVVPDRAQYAFGFELRSCRTGDYFFRLDEGGHLVVGYFNLVKAPLTPGERARLERAIEVVRQVDRSAPYGQGGCDFEQYYLKSPAGRFEKLWIGTGGRPAELDAFIDTVADLLRARFGEGEAKEFREATAIFREYD